MDLIVKTSAVALIAIVAGMLIKRTNPELSLLLSVSTVTLILFSAIGVSDGLRSLRQLVKQFSGSNEIYISAIIKCLGISFVTKVSTELCKDSSQSAIASAVEISGTVCALSVVMPLLMNLLSVIGGLN